MLNIDRLFFSFGNWSSSRHSRADSETLPKGLSGYRHLLYASPFTESLAIPKCRRKDFRLRAISTTRNPNDFILASNQGEELGYRLRASTLVRRPPNRNGWSVV